MNVITWVKGKARSFIAPLVRAEVRKAIEDMLPLILQLIEFQNSPKEDRLSYHDHTKDPLGNRGYYAGLKDRLLTIGVPVEEVDIDISDFERWLDEFSEIKVTTQSLLAADLSPLPRASRCLAETCETTTWSGSSHTAKAAGLRSGGSG